MPLLDSLPQVHREKILAGWSEPRNIVSFRVNHLNSSREEVVKALGEAGLPSSAWDGFEDAFYMAKEEHEYTLRGLEIYKQGKIYVQSLTSMIPALCLDLHPGQKILDMTAAPGSKTTQMASMLAWKCEITALEKFGIRHDKLVHTIKSQWAEKCVKVIKMDATELVQFFSKNEQKNQGQKMFDRILLDAPCSSDGRIDLSDETTYKWYSPEKSASKALLQYELLEQARKMLKDDGKLVYSTCAVNRTENEEVIQKFLTKHPEYHLLPCPIAPDYTLEENMNRWYPSPMMEGFFVSILSKN